MRHLITVVLVTILSAGHAAAGTTENSPLKIIEKKGTSVTAEAVVERLQTSEQLKAAAFPLLDRVRADCPACKRITLRISNDARMLKCGNYLAVVQVEDEQTRITGGIPSNMDIRAMKASRLDITRPDNQSMEIYYEVWKKLRNAERDGKKLNLVEACTIVAKKRKLLPAQVLRIYRGISQYYTVYAGKPL